LDLGGGLAVDGVDARLDELLLREFLDGLPDRPGVLLRDGPEVRDDAARLEQLAAAGGYGGRDVPERRADVEARRGGAGAGGGEGPLDVVQGRALAEHERRGFLDDAVRDAEPVSEAAHERRAVTQ